MSRTTRRKTTKPSYYNFESEAEFNFALESYRSNAPEPECPYPSPKVPLVCHLNWWGRYQWVEASYGTVEYKKWQRKSAEWWYEYRTSDAYLAHAAATNYSRYGFGKQSYKSFVAKTDAVHHSDCGYSVHKSCTPRSFRNGLTREIRQRTRELLHVGMVYDNWDELPFPKPKKDAAWWYW